MSEVGHPLLPLVRPEPYPRPDWDQPGDLDRGKDVRDRIFSLSAESRPDSAASDVLTTSTVRQLNDRTSTSSVTQQTAEEIVGLAGNKTSLWDMLHRWHWKFEILSLLLSICALVAIIILLAAEDGVALESWNSYFSLNTIISVLGTISRSSLASAVGSCLAQEKWNWFRKKRDRLYIFDRIDNASRGSLGSLQLLIWLRFYHWASLGAAVLVVLVAYDPFVQALVIQAGQDDDVSQAHDAAIGTASRLDTGILASQSGGAEGAQAWTDTRENLTCALQFYTQWSSEPDLGMVASIYGGFYNQSAATLRTPEFTCRTGNCTWAPFASLAVCASCRDATPHVTTSTRNASAAVPGGYIDGRQTVFSLPLNKIANWDAVFDSQDVARKRDGGGLVEEDSMIMSAQGTVNGSALYAFRGSTTFLFGFSLLHADEGYLNGSVPWNASHPYGTECGLELCTNIYRAESRAGVLSEQVLYSSAQRDMQSLLPTFLEGPSDRCGAYWNRLNNNSLYYDYAGNSEMAVNRSDLRLYITEQDATRHGIAGAAGPLGFNVSDRTLKSTIAWLKSQFASGHFVWYDDAATHATAHLNFFADASFWNQSAVASALVDRAALAATFARVGAGMTVWMRNLGYARTPAHGTATAWVLHTRVRWAFVAVPVATTLAGAVYCLVVLVATRRLGLAPWRDSCLAIMAYGIDDTLRDELRRAAGGPVGSAAGQSVRVELCEGKQGWGLQHH